MRLAPDRVSFSVGVETEHAAVAQAFKTNSAKLKAVLDALYAKGVQAREVRTSDLDITSRGQDGKPLGRFRVSNVVTVTREDPGAVSDLLQAAVDAGANQVSDLRFFLADRVKVQQRGLELAYKDARAKADTLAGLAGQELGEALCVEEAFAWGGGLQNNTFSFVGDSSGPGAVTAGTQEMPFGVHVTYALRAR